MIKSYLRLLRTILECADDFKNVYRLEIIYDLLNLIIDIISGRDLQYIERSPYNTRQ